MEGEIAVRHWCDSKLIMANNQKGKPGAKSHHGRGFLTYVRAFTQSECEPWNFRIYTVDGFHQECVRTCFRAKMVRGFEAFTTILDNLISAQIYSLCKLTNFCGGDQGYARRGETPAPD
jgi:hypothetical protein